MTKLMDDFPYLSEEETMKFLNYNETSMKNLRNSKVLTRYNIGHRYFYDRNELIQLIEFSDGSVIEGIYENSKIIIPNDEYKQTDENGSPMTFWGGLKKHKKESIEEGAELFAERRVELDPIYANGLYYGFIECGKSKWFQAEKIKAQIEENLSVLEMLKIHGTESSMFRVKMRIEGLEKELKELYDEI